MKPILEVIVLGHSEPSEADDEKWSHSLRLIPAEVDSFAALSKAGAASHLAEGEGELVALAANTETESLRAVGMFGTLLGAESSAFVMTSRVDDLSSVIESGPLECFGRGMRGSRVIVFRRGMFRQVGSLRPVSDTIWDWLIRAARGGVKFQTWPTSEAQPVLSRLPLLAPSVPDGGLDWLRQHLAEVSFADLGWRPMSPIDETALRAGLFQWHDFLDESHQLAQSIEGKGENQLGDYWHAILHRREPDYSNAKYWFRQIDPNSIFRELRRQADSLLERCTAPGAAKWRERLAPNMRWDPFAFVDLCQQCAADEESDLAIAVRRIQYAEMCLLMDMSYRKCAV